jgi:hypothetical protein
VELLGIRFLAPGFLALLALPLAALLLGARGGAVLALVTGTLESWRAAERNRPAQERRRRRVPLALVCLAVALAFAAFALARPARSAGPEARQFTLVVDRSPSMYLEEAGRSRLERALEPVRAWIARELHAGDELLWIDAEHPDGRVASAPPADLLTAPRVPLAEPDWPRYDRADALWIGDRFDPIPVQAGFSASGGRAVPGPIGREGTTRLDWDGERVVRVENAFSAGQLACFVDPNLPAPLRELARLWADRRGLALHETRNAADLFALVLVRAGERREVELARDGWSAHARLRAALVPAAGESAWMTVGGPCVLAAPGSVRTSIAELDEPAGDPAAFAVSWGELFDAELLDPPGVVPLGERTARGEPAWRAPAAASTGAGGADEPLTRLCALGAALLALAAWVLRGIRA